ncbi:T9SS type A sorting domain-containing protein [Flavobacterium succinicans]|uniref:Y_Y_Y domain protein n=1 Tax=Flavobacterium succinicans TaxID=29536 RepID=A0A199XN73_9FLAO|nr:T9SS type A sorting domain-containing protein [Flavobacterium succinicans]OAZ02872.1 Y_Y_Y domain protein [Flavobacterium succinicans]
MKKFYLVMILLVTGLGFAQTIGTYNVVAKLNIKPGGGSYGGSCKNDVKINLIYNDGTRQIINENLSSIPSGSYTVYTKTLAIPATSKPTKIQVTSSRNWKRAIGGCGGNGSFNDDARESTQAFSCKTVYNDIVRWWDDQLTIENIPQLEVIQGADNGLPTDTSISIYSNTGFLPSEYNWQYSLDLDNWINLPQFSGKSEITINAKDVLGENAGEFHGKNIYFRQVACNTYSASVNYIIRQSAPEIVSKLEEKTKCFDSADGKLKVKFNRPLFASEDFTFSIRGFDEEKQMWKSVECSSQENEISLDATNSYEFPCIFSKGKYGITFSGFINGSNSEPPYTEKNPYIFYIDSPTPVNFSLNSSNVTCYGSADGTLTINASGGSEEGYEYSLNNGVTWIPFTDTKSKKETLNGLSPVTKPSIVYNVMVRDKNGCMAKQGDKAKVLSETLSEPLAPLTVTYTFIKNPTFYGATNGVLVAAITGGTIKSDLSYWYEWKNSSGAVLPTTTQYNAVDKTYNIRLEGIPAGNYTLTVKDQNYDLATTKAGCTINASVQELKQPEKIEITLEERQPISCNSENLDTDTDKFSDGILQATVNGGTPFTGSANHGLPYKYIWSKYNTATKSWEELTDYTTATAENLSQGNYSLNVEDANGIVQGTYNTTDLVTALPTTKAITEPTKLALSFTSGNVSCYEGNNGWVTAHVTGGTGLYTYKWYDVDGGLINENTISQLTGGTYTVEVSDKNGCFITDSKTITAPKSPVAIEYEAIVTPTFSGATNGKIVAKITGGTPNDDHSYGYEWKNSKGDLQAATAELKNGSYTMTINNLSADDYFLTVKDKNYNIATSQDVNCSILDSKVTLSEPDPLKVVFEVVRSISCNSSNEFGNATDTTPKDGQRDESQDGILVAHVTGGVPLEASLNNGLPYFYYWKKQQADGSWVSLPNQTTATASNLSHGKYALNVKDGNGIVLGTYVNNVLTHAIDVTQMMAEPSKLAVTISKGDVFCYEGSDGWATAHVTGGTSPYSYRWSNGVTLDKNTVLRAGQYSVFITDARGCTTQASVTVTQPAAPLALRYKEIVNPSLYEASNGKIVVEVTGGTSFSDKSYWFEWKNSSGKLQPVVAAISNGIYTLTIDNLSTDDYFLTIKDKNYDIATSKKNTCSVLDSKVALKAPDPLKAVFEVVRSISCNSSNEFGTTTDTTPKDGQRDESQDGILVAHVTGGVPLEASLNKGLPYFYYWKKRQADGSWIALPNLTTATASNLSHGEYALNVKDGNGIVLGTYVNNVLTHSIDVTQMMAEPSKLAVTITKGDVFCHEGNDGWATAHVTGGTSPYSYRWSNGVTLDKNTVLRAGQYSVFITDARGCTTQASVTLTQPAAPLTLRYKEVLNPSFYKATNGKIVVEVTGGTILPDKSYWFEWKNSKGDLPSTVTTSTSFANGVYTIVLSGLAEETYRLTIRDAHYDTAIYKAGCTVVQSVTTLEDPDPLEATFEVVRTISCNEGNAFGDETDNNPIDNQRDESQDGILKVQVKGGIPLKADQNNGLPYFYTWKKQQKDGTWVVWNEHDATAEHLSAGTYALSIEDGNGIKLGTYVNNVLVKETPITQYMPAPAPLQLTFTKLDTSCNNGNDGWAAAHVTGGTPPYTYDWTTGETTSKIENITASNYFVVVRDAKGCVVQGSIFVGDPKGVLTTETVKNPTCFGDQDGAITLEVSGGNTPYSYLWNTGATSKDVKNLVAGQYEVTISCLDCCVYKKKFTLKDPNPVVVNLGKDITLCTDQALALDASIADEKATYNWTSTNGFSSNQAKVSLTKSGTYRVQVTSSLGCIGEDEIIITTNQAAIGAEFLVSSQAYVDEEVILVNTSTPFGETTQWVIPKGVKIVEQKEKYIIVKFDTVGVYVIGLQQTQGACSAVYTKNITVEKRSTLPNSGTLSKFITDFIVTPNPSDGNFKTIVNLENNSAINIRLFSSVGELITQKKDSGKKKYELDFTTSLQSGMYILVLETEQQSLVKKIIVK